MKKINKLIATQSFHTAIDASARLAAYSTARFTEEVGPGLYQERADELAHTDLLLLAISVRRLSEVTSEIPRLKKLSVSLQIPFINDVSAGFSASHKQVTVWDLLGVLIHCREYDLYKTDFSLRSLTTRLRQDIDEMLSAMKSQKDIPAIVYVKSDREKPIVFSISELVREIATFISEIEDVLADENIYVGFYANP